MARGHFGCRGPLSYMSALTQSVRNKIEISRQRLSVSLGLVAGAIHTDLTQLLV